MRYVLLASILLGCGGGSSRSTPDGGTVQGLDTYAGFVSAFGAAECQGLVGCGVYPDQASCAAVFTDDPQTEAELSAGKLVYDKAAATSCINALKSSFVCASYTTFLGFYLPDDCPFFGVATGTVASGGTCLSDECQPGLTCNTSGSFDPCAMGTCEQGPAQNVAIGGDCSNGAGCVSGAFCDQTTMKCAKVGAEGDACAPSETVCAAGLMCDGSKCAKPAVGTSCTTGAFIDTCGLASFYCQESTSTCQTRIATGQSCVNDTNGCAGDADCVSGTCVARGKAGDACGTNQPSCLHGYTCGTDNKCAVNAVSACP